MKTNVTSLAKRLLILIGLYVLCVMPLSAQEYDGVYREALRRIEEARLSGAIALYLPDLNLTTLPPEIGQLTTLRTLVLYNNQLTTLPPQIGQLTALRRLSLTHNQLTSLPPQIDQLTALQELYLSNNQLTTLPPQIGQLTALQELYLSNNQLTSLLPQIGQLTSLQGLYLSDNQLTTLPLELGQLQLTELYLDGNPLTFPPPEVQAQGGQAILAYLREYPAMMMRQTIAAVAAGIGGIALVILAFRWRQRRAWGEKKKRL